MSEEIINETPEVIEQESAEVVEKVETEKAPEVERPWKKKEPEEQAIPYSRFREVNQEKKLYQEKVEQYEKELQELRERTTQKKEEFKAPEDIKPEDFDSVADYLNALTKATKESTLKEFTERMENQKRQKEQEEYANNLIKNFQANVEEAVKYNPEVVEAIQYIEGLADRINPHVRRALLTDDNSADLCFEIATNPDLLKLVVTGDPIDAVRAMSKWSAKFERKSVEKVEDNSKELEDIKTMIPKTIKGAATRSSKKPEDMNMSEYKAWRATLKNKK